MDKIRIAPVKLTFVVLLVLIGTLYYALSYQRPSASQTFTIGNTPVSVQNAVRHLEVISESPHYTGQREQHAVRDYLVKELRQMGMQVELHNTQASAAYRYTASRVSNIVAHLKATTTSPKRQALALVSHYDSASFSSPGASDAGSGVVVILEAMRALIASGLPHKNDIYVIFTDAEEQGLLGARAFVQNHKSARDIGLVLNFEARGSGGPSYTLMETNNGNQGLVEVFTAADIQFPAANSMMYSIYKMLPNDTDLTVFREEGDIKGFNFAFIDDHFDYHTAQDTPQRLDPETLNHQIDYVSALLTHLKDLDLSQLDSEQDLVYFNIANLAVYHYPFSFVLPMALLVAFAFLMMVANGIKQNTLNVKHIGIGLLPLAIVIAVALLSSLGLWSLLQSLYPQLSDSPHGFPYNGHAIIAMSLSLTALGSLFLFKQFTKRFGPSNEASHYVSSVLVWIIVNVLIAVYLTGAGFFILSAVAGVAIFGNLLRSEASVRRQMLVMTLVSIPVLAVIAPQIPVFVIGLGMGSLAVATIITALLLLLLAPLFVRMAGQNAIIIALFFIACGAMVAVHTQADYSPERKKPSSVNYIYDTQSDKAYLFSFNRELDDFTSQMFNQQQTDNSPLRGLFPISSWRNPNFVSPVDTLALSPMSYQATVTSSTDNLKTVRLKITPNRTLHRVELLVDSPIYIQSLRFNGQAAGVNERQIRAGRFARYVVSDHQPITIEFGYRSDKLAQFRLLGIAHDLANRWPQFPERAEHIMPSPFRLSDTTIISQPIEFAN